MAKSGNKSNGQTDHRGDNAADEPRDSEGRFTKARGRGLSNVKLPELNGRNAALGALGAGIAVAAVAAGGALFRGWNDRGGKSVGNGSDMDYNVTSDRDDTTVREARDVIDDDKREAFAPATMPVPSRVEAMGSGEI